MSIVLLVKSRSLRIRRISQSAFYQPLRVLELEGAVGEVLVVVARVHAQDALEMSPSKDEDVAFDLYKMGEQVGRAGMVRVLARGTDLIHSDTEFRREYANEFPNTPIRDIHDPCLTYEFASTSSFAPIDAVQQLDSLRATIGARERTLATLRTEQRSSEGLRHFMFRAAAEECTLILERLQGQLAELEARTPPEQRLRRAYLLRHERAEFLARRRAIQLRALQDAFEVVPAKRRPALERRIHLLENSRIEDHSLDSLMALPPLSADDNVARRHRRADHDTEVEAIGDHDAREEFDEGNRDVDLDRDRRSQDD